MCFWRGLPPDSFPIFTVFLVATSDFTVICGRDYPGPSINILAIVAYSLKDCAKACASYNKNANSIKCKGAAFSTDLTNDVPVNYGTCWLKNNTASPVNSKDMTRGSVLLNTWSGDGVEKRRRGGVSIPGPIVLNILFRFRACSIFLFELLHRASSVRLEFARYRFLHT